MYFRSILSGTLALLLLAGAASPGAALDLKLPGVFGGKSSSAKQETYQLAQASDPRVGQLEEQIRSLNGKLEELNFQILQMQEQMRKMQEDNEFRFQELEKKSGQATGNANQNVAKAPAGDTPAAATAETPTATTPPADATDTADAEIQPPAPGGQGTPPRTFGTITVDKDGNVTSTSIDPPTDLLPQTDPNAAANDDVNVAALPKTDDPEELYRNSYQFILSGDYKTAEAGFRDHIQRFPSDTRAADANYWLGESLLGQQKYSDAAEVLLAASKQFPKSKKAPDMLLKLGVSLVGLNQKDVACATFAEVEKRYPDASAAMKQRVKQERALAAC